MKLIPIVLWLLSTPVWAQNIDTQKLDKLCQAIAHAEGYYTKGTIPQRYNNPGDLKSRRGILPLPGQRKIGKAGHIMFVTDAAGWSALRGYIANIVEGRSRHYSPSSTLSQVSHVYAHRWQPWLRQVTKQLGVPSSTRIAEFLKPDYYVDSAEGHCYTM